MSFLDVLRRRLDASAIEILNAVGEAVLASGSDGRIQFANERACALLGYSAAELTGRDLDEVLTTMRTAPAAATGDETVSAHRWQRGSDEAVVTTRLGHQIPVSISSARMDGGRVYVLRDVRDAKHAESLIRRNLSLLQSTLDSTGEGIVVLDRERTIVLRNQRALEMWNVPDELQRHGDDRELLRYAIGQLVDPEAFRAQARHFDWTNPAETLDVLELKDGRVLERYSIPHRLGGEIAGRVWSFRDITQSRAAQRAMERSEKRYRRLFEHNLAGVYTFDLDGVILDCNSAFARLLGAAEPSEVVGRSIDEVHRSVGDVSEIRKINDAMPTLPAVEVELVARGGRTVRALESVGRLEVDGEVVLQGTVVDIDDLKRAEEQVRFHAYHDILTHLPNRQLFRDRLGIAIARAQRMTRNAAVLFVDLDDFKKVNDTLGPTAGDELLVLVAERLVGAVRKADTVARPGGDEFQVIVGDVTGTAPVERVARKILSTLSKPVSLGGHEVFLTASIGVALYPADGTDEESLLKSADNALFEAKQAGRNTYRMATAELNRRASERFTLESSLRQALDRDELALHYQPIVDAASGKIVAFEALVRWNHPQRGLLPSLDFISVAEESALIVPLGEWVLRRACADAMAWQAKGLPGVRVSVNVSPRQFQRPGLVVSVHGALRATGLAAELLELEVTESVAAQDPQATTSILRALRGEGIRIAIDDLGTGYSSLSYLKQFPVTTVKIDKSFVATVLTDRSDAAIVSAVIGVAHSLEMEVVAEGVESEAQASFLREHRCNLLQGYHFGRPMPVEAWLQNDDVGRAVSRG